MKIKLVVTDIDGVWTDGGMYYSERGEEMKKFNTIDSGGVLFLNAINLPLAVITGEDSPSTNKRLEKLGIKKIFHGAKDKLSTILNYCKELGIGLNEIAFLGDDLNDIKLLQNSGLSAVPNSSADYVKKEANWVLSKKGGEGAFREFVEKLLIEEGLFEEALRKVIDKI